MKKVVRAIIMVDGKVLLGKRARKDAIGKWALVGGAPENGETMEDAIAREVQEELGLIFKPTFWMEEVDGSGQGGPWKVSYFYGMAEGALNPRKEEVSEVEVFGERDLDDLDIAYTHREILRRFFQDAIK